MLVASVREYCVKMSQQEKENLIDREPVVHTANGKIKGSVLETRLGILFNAFRGIRYGKAPIGDLRLKVNTPQKYSQPLQLFLCIICRYAMCKYDLHLILPVILFRNDVYNKYERQLD